jgi:adenylate kinase
MKSFAGKVILLTGAPGTGKSTLVTILRQSVRPLQSVDYGQLLLARLEQRTGAKAPYSDLRKFSSDLVSHKDVERTDAEFIRQLGRLRTQGNVLIDSHAVTKERFGYRITPYSTHQLGALRLDAVVSLHCDPGALAKRIRIDPQGRRRVTAEEARHHQFLQEAVGAVYAISCGCPLFVIDNTHRSADEVAAEFISVLTKVGARFFLKPRC